VSIVGKVACKVWRQVTVHACYLVRETVVRRERSIGLHHRPGLPVEIDFGLDTRARLPRRSAHCFFALARVEGTGVVAVRRKPSGERGTQKLLRKRLLFERGNSPRIKAPQKMSALRKSGSGRAASAKGVYGKELGDRIQAWVQDYCERARLLISSDTSSHGSPNLTEKSESQMDAFSITKSQVKFCVHARYGR
jgi:hypothetical protein